MTPLMNCNERIDACQSHRQENKPFGCTLLAEISEIKLLTARIPFKIFLVIEKPKKKRVPHARHFVKAIVNSKVSNYASKRNRLEKSLADKTSM